MNRQRSHQHLQPSVQMHIERLVVDEPLLRTGDATTLGIAIETELTQLLFDYGFSLNSDPHTPIPSRDIQLIDGTSPSQLGRQIARTVYETIGAGNQLPPEPQLKGINL
jgi:hypothetical protein